MARLPAVNPHRLSRSAWKDGKTAENTRNVFFIYLEANKARFLQQASGVHKQAVSLCSKDWQVLSKDDRAPYEEKAKAAKKQYDEDVKAFSDGGGAMKQCKASEGRERKNGAEEHEYIRVPAPLKNQWVARTVAS